MINPLKFYSITELLELAKEGFFPIDNRRTILERIESGHLKAINYGTLIKKNYKIKGEDVLIFLQTGVVEQKEIQKNDKPKRGKKKEKDEESVPKA